MALKDLFVRRKRPAAAARDRLFALSTAQVTLDMELGLKPAGVAAVIFKPMSAGEFVRAESDLEQLLDSVASELSDAGFGPQLLAAAFRFEGKKEPVYWIYGFKNAKFWPFIPAGDGQERDNAEELELKAKLEKELPIEPDLTKWLALYDAPI